MSKQTIITILAIIGGLVVLKILLKITFALIGPLILLALGFGVYKLVADNKRIGGPR